MEVYKKYEFADDEYTCKYTMTVYDNFIRIDRFGLGQNGQMMAMEYIKFDKDFAYEIAKKIIEEYERMNGNDMA